MDELKLSVQTVQNVLNYLAEKPYKEVAELISSIMNEVQKKEDKQEVAE